MIKIIFFIDKLMSSYIFYFFLLFIYFVSIFYSEVNFSHNKKVSFKFILYPLSNRHVRFYSTNNLINYNNNNSDLLYDNYEDITNEVINKLLVNQKISISQEELNKLKIITSVKFYMPLNKETLHAFIALVGKSNSRIYKSGIYIFTHLATQNSYVGSSNNLGRRLFGYFRHEYNQKENTGLLLPILKQEGVAAFSLEIFIIPSDYPKNSYLFLEQYHLLNKKFNLNTQRIVQFRALRPHKIFLYDIEGKILYYSSESHSNIQKELGIHYTTFSKCINENKNYLNYFKITNIPIEGASKSNMNIIELINLIKEKQELNRTNNIKGNRGTKSKSIIIKNIITGETHNFSNILGVVSYLESINNKINRNTIAKYLNTGESFKGYLFNEISKENKNSIRIEIYDLNKNLIEFFDNLKAVSEKYGVSETSIRLSSYKDKPYKGKYYFFYKK